MTKQDFLKFREQLQKEEEEIIKGKGEDYTKSSEDQLANFKEGSIFGLTPLQTAGIFTKKHVDAIYNYIKTDGKSESEPIRERIKDARNYLLFILALIEDEKKWQILDFMKPQDIFFSSELGAKEFCDKKSNSQHCYTYKNIKQ